MDPKPEKLKQNIVLKFRNLKVTRRKHLWRSDPFTLSNIIELLLLCCMYVLSYISFTKLDQVYFQVADGKRSCMFWKRYSDKK